MSSSYSYFCRISGYNNANVNNVRNAFFHFY